MPSRLDGGGAPRVRDKCRDVGVTGGHLVFEDLRPDSKNRDTDVVTHSYVVLPVHTLVVTRLYDVAPGTDPSWSVRTSSHPCTDSTWSTRTSSQPYPDHGPPVRRSTRVQTHHGPALTSSHPCTDPSWSVRMSFHPYTHPS